MENNADVYGNAMMDCVLRKAGETPPIIRDKGNRRAANFEGKGMILGQES